MLCLILVTSVSLQLIRICSAATTAGAAVQLSLFDMLILIITV
jgi:hypothetical protein